MIEKVYAIYDECQKTCLLQVFYANDECAKRDMDSLFANKALFRQIPNMEKYPNTFSLMCIGEFDTLTGNLINYEHKEVLFTFDKFCDEKDLVSHID